MNTIEKIKYLIKKMMFWKLREDLLTIRQQVLTVQQQAAAMRSDTVQQAVALRYHTWHRPNELPTQATQLDDVLPLSEQLSRLKQLAPHAFAIWHPLLDVNENAYDGTPVDSCSVSGHPVATLFRFFLVPYLKGRVVDIGCGPQTIPTYLEDYHTEAIYGVDPLSEPEEHPFHFMKGFAEFLPWADDQFNLVVAATSLDHVLLLDKVFEEVSRVLSEDGFFVVWDGFIPDSKTYDPYSQDIEKVDAYHLFHFDRDSFLEAIKPYFTVFEELSVDGQSNFFVLRPL